MSDGCSQNGLKIGWAQADITPSVPCLVAGQFYARVSERVLDPVTATALAVESDGEHAVLVSCDMGAIPDGFRDAIRALLSTGAEGLDPMKVLFNATHTHTGPPIHRDFAGGTMAAGIGVDLEAMDHAEFQACAAPRIAAAIRKAWASRLPGGLAFGMGYAVVGRNRRWVDTQGKSCMYGETNTPLFSHIEGYEDHSLGLVATVDPAGKLTGLVVNVPCPSQVSENEFVLSADYWCETRAELRTRFGKDLFILAQCSAAGDQSPHLLYDKQAVGRMLGLKGRTIRQEIAQRIANAVEDVLPFVLAAADRSPKLVHRVEEIDLPLSALTQADVDAAEAEARKLRVQYEAEMQKLQADPSLRKQPRWYTEPTGCYRQMKWQQGVAARFDKQKTQPNLPVEFHVLRLGDLALATSPFEYYLDFGIFIKARSPAVQTLLVQLTGSGSYCPSRRSLPGGGYGSLPASNPVGPEGGRKLAERTVDILLSLWPQT
jgi:hypothetical protein